MSQKTYMYDTQWQALINAISGGDTSAIATALGQIKTSIDSIETALGNLSTDVTQNSTQWNNLVNAITNQSLTVDLSNLTSSAVSNLSNVTGATVTDAINLLISTLNSNLLKFKDVSVTVGTTVYDGYYIGTGDTGLSASSKLVSVQVIGASNNHAAFVGFYEQNTQKFRVNCLASNSTVYVRVWYI